MALNRDPDREPICQALDGQRLECERESISIEQFCAEGLLVSHHELAQLLAEIWHIIGYSLPCSMHR